MVPPPDERNTPYPAGYEDVEDLVNRTTGLILFKEAQIERLRTAKDGPPMRLIPPGLGPQPIYSPAKLIVDLEQEIIHLQEDSFRQIEQLTRLDRKHGSRVRDLAIRKLFPNKYLAMDAAELERYRDQIKGHEESQQYQQAQWEQAKYAKVEKEQPAKQDPQPVQPAGQRLVMSARYTQLLESPQREALPEKGPEPVQRLLTPGRYTRLLEPPQADRAALATEDKVAPSKGKELDGPEP